MLNKQIMTVTGPIAIDSLGLTLMHEHLLWDDSHEDHDPNRRNDDSVEAIEEMKQYAADGGCSLVELTCHGLGQDIAELKQISEESGVQVVAATGFYRECYYPDYVFTETADQLADRLIKDCKVGIDGTDIKPGIIGELASEFRAPGLSVNEEKVFHAGGAAGTATGMAVSTHCWEGGLAFEQIKVLKSEGMAPEKIVIGHLAVAEGLLDHVIRIADEGVNLGIDCIGYQFDGFGDEDRADMVCELIDRGYISQITLSHDIARHSFFKCRGGHGYTYVITTFKDMLTKRGITDSQIDIILAENPKRILSHSC